jgi:hypothetical protein
MARAQVVNRLRDHFLARCRFRRAAGRWPASARPARAARAPAAWPGCRSGSQSAPAERFAIAFGEIVHGREAAGLACFEAGEDRRYRLHRHRLGRPGARRMDPGVRGNRHPVAGILLPQHGAFELQHLAGLPERVDDRLVDGFRSDGAQACGEIGDEPREMQQRVGGRGSRIGSNGFLMPVTEAISGRVESRVCSTSPRAANRLARCSAHHARTRYTNGLLPGNTVDSVDRRMRRQLRLDDAVADRVAHQLAHRVDFELGHDPCAVRFRRFCRDAEHGRDFFVGLTFGQQLQDFAFA